MNANNDKTDENAPETPAAEGNAADARGSDGLIQPVATKKSAAKKTASKKAETPPVPVPTAEPVPPVATPPAADAAAPAETAPPEAAPAAPVAETAPPVVEPEAPVAETAPAEPVADPVAEHAATGEVAPVATQVQTVYVTAPVPPKPKNNRLFGVLMSLVATVVFAAAYAGVTAALMLIIPNLGLVGLQQFLLGAGGIVPVVVFFIAMILWSLLANRASWWSWVIGSLVIGLFTFGVSIGALMLVTGEFAKSPSEASAVFMAYLSSPIFIAAALVARETAIWFGAAIAKRGRTVRERNYATFQAFEMEQAQKRAELGGTAAA